MILLGLLAAGVFGQSDLSCPSPGYQFQSVQWPDVCISADETSGELTLATCGEDPLQRFFFNQHPLYPAEYQVTFFTGEDTWCLESDAVLANCTDDENDRIYLQQEGPAILFVNGGGLCLTETDLDSGLSFGDCDSQQQAQLWTPLQLCLPLIYDAEPPTKAPTRRSTTRPPTRPPTRGTVKPTQLIATTPRLGLPALPTLPTFSLPTPLPQPANPLTLHTISSCGASSKSTIAVAFSTNLRSCNWRVENARSFTVLAFQPTTSDCAAARMVLMVDSTPVANLCGPVTSGTTFYLDELLTASGNGLSPVRLDQSNTPGRRQYTPVCVPDCPVGSSCVYNAATHTNVCKCLLTCPAPPANAAPVCTSDGQRLANLCVVQAMSCANQQSGLPALVTVACSTLTTIPPITLRPTLKPTFTKSPTARPTIRTPTNNPTRKPVTKTPTTRPPTSPPTTPPTTPPPTTRPPTTRPPTTRPPTTHPPTTPPPTTPLPTTRPPTTRLPTTRLPTTRPPTTRPPTTRPQTTRPPTTRPPTTRPPTTRPPTTRSPTTRPPTTRPTTRLPTTHSPTTRLPTTRPPTTRPPTSPPTIPPSPVAAVKAISISPSGTVGGFRPQVAGHANHSLQILWISTVSTQGVQAILQIM